MIPFRTPFFLPYFYSTLTWRLPATEEPTLYLTFDDGPMPGPTDFVLETLSQRKASATFFCIGDNIKKHPAMLSSIRQGGHATGNHTFNHLNGWRTADDVYYDNIALCADALSTGSNHGEQPLFRPPYGKIRVSQIRHLKAFRIIMWDVLTHDYDQRLSPDYILRKSIGAVRNGSIIVFHDSLKAEKNLTFVLPRLMDHFGGLGYEFRSIK